jgi:hypothetical protein
VDHGWNNNNNNDVRRWWGEGMMEDSREGE